MAPSFDCFSSLLCAEDNIIFDENDRGGLVEELEDTWEHPIYDRNHSQIQNLDVQYVSFPLPSEECLRLMMESELHHLPNGDYVSRLRSGDLDIGSRTEAIDWIEKVREHFGFGPLCAYLSINYLDRFLSVYELPQRVWTMKLLAVGCISLAAKMEESDVPTSLDLQVGESKYIFEAKTIQRMELLVLNTLKWRMQAITPFSFIDYFLQKINDDDEAPIGASILQSSELILSTVRGIDFIEFRPSEIAAAVAISVVGDGQTVETEKASSDLIQHVEKERVLKCVKMIQELSSKNGPSAKDLIPSVSVPESPIGVLNNACFSYKSDEPNVAPCANSSHSDTPDAKRRKLDKTFGE
ncbi:cyclin-D4-2-like isoform X2 [Vigna unguiculata]|uniref:cyclin-D4-2-like isoform X2 n=1 Tax=Vigna unguiculata TaxID=3917 RepID=UPI00101683B4|nr:cyclin-D4-2-like isoform X2 [Vigna unguiculata]